MSDRLAYETLAPLCRAAGHPLHPQRTRVYDFVHGDRAVRLRFESRSCPCGDRLYVADADVRQVVPPAILLDAEAR